MENQPEKFGKKKLPLNNLEDVLEEYFEDSEQEDIQNILQDCKNLPVKSR